MSERLKILDVLADSIKANQYAKDMQGRSMSLLFCKVTDNQDPLGLRRIKVTTEGKGALTSTDWLIRMPLIPNYDPPLPPIGSCVVCGFFSGDPHDGAWISVVNNSLNPPDTNQKNPINDSTILIPGDNKETIKGDDTRKVEGDRTSTIEGNEDRKVGNDLIIDVGETLTLKNTAGASLTLHKSGFIILKDKFGNKLVLGGASGGHNTPSDLEWTIAGDINLLTTGKVKINSNEIAVIGAEDTDNDVIVDSGQ